MININNNKIKLSNIYVSKSRFGKRILVSKELGRWVVVDEHIWNLIKVIDDSSNSSMISNLNKDLFKELYENGIISINGIANVPQKKLHDVIVENNRTPNLCILHVSNVCNLNCLYCYAHDNETTKDVMELDIMKKSIDRFFELKKDYIKIEFHGGEPLLQYKTIKECCKYAKLISKETNKKVEFSMQSNLTFLNEECLEFLKEYGVQLRISLDGPKQINDFYRKDLSGKGTYDRVKENLDILNRNGIYPEVVSVVTNKNIDKLIEMTKLFISLNLFRLRFIPFWAQGMGNKMKNQEVSQDYMVKKYFELLEWILNYNKTTKDKTKSIKLYTLNKEIEALTSFKRSYMCLRCPCGAGMNMVDVSINGDIYPCEEMNEQKEMYVGNIYLGSIEEQYFKSDVVKMLVDRNPDNVKECAECPWKRHCQSGCANKNFQKFGSVNTISDRCEYYKVYFEELIWFLYKHKKFISSIIYDSGSM